MLGLIQWDFETLQMHFDLNGRGVILYGIANKKVLDIAPIINPQKGKLKLYCKAWREGSSVSQRFDSPQIQELLNSYQDVLQEPRGLPPKRKDDHHIPLLPGCGPIAVRPYRYPHFQKNDIEHIVKELLEAGVIRSSTCPYTSPVLLVKKHDGTWCMYIDYWALNRITMKDKFPIPMIDKLLDELAGACYFSKLDLRSGYHDV